MQPAQQRNARMVAPPELYWPNGSTLRIAFINNPSASVKKKIIDTASQWLEHINLKFNFVDGKEGDIRITTDTQEWSSYPGISAQQAAQNEPTMKLAINDDTTEREYVTNVLHEFGHMLGAVHEHQHPQADIPWDKPKAYAYYQKLTGWTTEQVDQFVFTRYPEEGFSFTPYDTKSIMHYPVPNEITLGDWAVEQSDRLSANDIAHMSKAYPKN